MIFHALICDECHAECRWDAYLFWQHATLPKEIGANVGKEPCPRCRTLRRWARVTVEEVADGQPPQPAFEFEGD